MTMICPNCGGRMRSNGIRRCQGVGYRRFVCDDCKHVERVDANVPRERVPPPRRFNALQIAEMVESRQSARVLAERFGCSRELICQVRAGQLYRDLLPEWYVPRSRNGPRCDRCYNWRDGRCSIGFPDPDEEGVMFARDCELYQET